VPKLDVHRLDVRGLGDYIREQRSHAQISLRQLATLAGVSNPYLSQIERGLRRPSAEILQQIAKALRISAEALYVQAGILDERHVDSDVTAAIFSDLSLSEQQKQVLIEMYQSFVVESDGPATPETGSGKVGADASGTTRKKRTRTTAATPPEARPKATKSSPKRA